MTSAVETKVPSLPMEVRCSVAVFRGGAVLLVRSTEGGETVWKLPGGHVRADEGMCACGRRELAEETGLEAGALRCGLLKEVHDPRTGRFVAEVVLFPLEKVRGETRVTEAGREPQFVPLADLGSTELRPAIAGPLRGMFDLHRNELAAQDDEPPVDDSPYAFTTAVHAHGDDGLSATGRPADQ